MTSSKWKHFLALHEGNPLLIDGALLFSLICVWTDGWANNGDACDLRRNGAHYDVTVMVFGDMCGNVTDMQCNHSVSSLSSLARQIHYCFQEVLWTHNATANVLFWHENYVMRYIVTNRLVYYTILYAIPFLVNISIGMCSETWFDKGPVDEVTPIS